MNPRLGWGLVLAGFTLGGFFWGWRGVALAGSAVVFWLLMQLSRTLRVMRRAAGTPVGSVPSAMMLAAKLSPGLTMLEVLDLTRSLGEAIGPPEDEHWRWQDAGGDAVLLHFADGRLHDWQLQRAGPPADTATAAPTPLNPPAGGAT